VSDNRRTSVERHSLQPLQRVCVENMTAVAELFIIVLTNVNSNDFQTDSFFQEIYTS